jgi:hypothetical protein
VSSVRSPINSSLLSRWTPKSLTASTECVLTASLKKWGSPNDTKLVRCAYIQSQESDVKVPCNLYDTLKGVRFEKAKERPTWADAISINQQDVAERSQQVRLMRDELANASEMLIWLGEHTERMRTMCTSSTCWIGSILSILVTSTRIRHALALIYRTMRGRPIRSSSTCLSTRVPGSSRRLLWRRN